MTLLRNRSALAVLLAAVVASALGLLLGLSTTDRSTASAPASSFEVPAAELAGKAQGTSIEAYHFDHIAATSSVIVHGTVKSVARGRSYGTGHDEMGWSNAELQIDDVLAGNPAPTVTIEQLTTQAGMDIAINGLAPLNTGDVGFFFLRPGENGTYVLVNSQGRYVEREGQLHGRHGGDKTVAAIERMSPGGLRGAVLRARTDVAQGRLKAQRPAFGGG